MYWTAIWTSGVYPPISVLPSLSRLMKDGIGEGYTRKDHPDVSNQLFASYAKVSDARGLASVIGVEELSPTDKLYLDFGNQLLKKNSWARARARTAPPAKAWILGWRLLSILPREELDRLDEKVLDEHYRSALSAALSRMRKGGEGQWRNRYFPQKAT